MWEEPGEGKPRHYISSDRLVVLNMPGYVVARLALARLLFRFLIIIGILLFKDTG